MKFQEFINMSAHIYVSKNANKIKANEFESHPF